MRRQALSLLVENNPGVTSRISGLFSRRGYNIDSFSSGVTADPKYTRITIVASGDELILDQIEKQLLKLEDVLDIKKLEPGLSVTRELILELCRLCGRLTGHLGDDGIQIKFIGIRYVAEHIFQRFQIHIVFSIHVHFPLNCPVCVGEAPQTAAQPPRWMRSAS